MTVGALWPSVVLVPTSSDSQAVVAARALLVEQGVAQVLPWRTTVVPDDDGAWIVRTWIRTPHEDARPSGPPDYVHRVEEGVAEGVEPHVHQVHPAL